MKLYFQEKAESCCTLSWHYKYMKENNIKEMIVFEAERDTNIDYFYCTFYDEIGEKNEGCGKRCDEYNPRNGKNGRCNYSGHCYSPTDKFKLLKLK